MCLCSLSYPACQAHAPFCIVIYGLSGCTIFFHVMSQRAWRYMKLNMQSSSGEVKNTWSCVSASPHAVMVWCLIKHKDIFTRTFIRPLKVIGSCIFSSGSGLDPRSPVFVPPLTAPPWRWRQHSSPKPWCLHTKLYGVMTYTNHYCPRNPQTYVFLAIRQSSLIYFTGGVRRALPLPFILLKGRHKYRHSVLVSHFFLNPFVFEACLNNR